MTEKIKQIIIAAVVIIVAFIGFSMFFSEPDSSDSALDTENSGETEIIKGQAVLSLLNRLKEVELDMTVFSDPAFVSLINFERPIAEQVIGRPNPFLPIGRDYTGPVIPTSTSTGVRR